MSTNQYTVRFIWFEGRRVPMVLQSKNGPCPLLAIANVLFLRGALNMHPDTHTISFNELSQRIKTYLEIRLSKLVLNGGRFDDESSTGARSAAALAKAAAHSHPSLSTPAQRQMAAIQARSPPRAGAGSASAFNPRDSKPAAAAFPSKAGAGVDVKHAPTTAKASSADSKHSPSTSGGGASAAAAAAAAAAVSESLIANAIQSFEDTVRLLPRLEHGLDVNVSFSNPLAFEFTPEISMFDLYGIRLCHGWCVDPQDKRTAPLLLNTSYNNILDALTLSPTAVAPPPSAAAAAARPAAYAPGSAPPLAASAVGMSKEDGSPAAAAAPAVVVSVADSKSRSPTGFDSKVNTPPSAAIAATAVVPVTVTVVQPVTVVVAPEQPPAPAPISVGLSTGERSIISQFLEETKTQLTVYGLAELHSLLRDNELCVWFQNNHFNTLYKRGGRLFTLVTDSGLVGAVADIAWALIQDTTGDSMYCDADFRAFNANNAPQSQQHHNPHAHSGQYPQHNPQLIQQHSYPQYQHPNGNAQRSQVMSDEQTALALQQQFQRQQPAAAGGGGGEWQSAQQARAAMMRPPVVVPPEPKKRSDSCVVQ